MAATASFATLLPSSTRPTFPSILFSSLPTSFSSYSPPPPLPRSNLFAASPLYNCRPLGSPVAAASWRRRALAADQTELSEDAPAASGAEQSLSLPVSPSDMLTMFFLAEGTIDDSSIPIVTNALKEVEGISDLDVRVLEGIATVELTKQTTVQATGVASNLVEIIQGSGFKLQTLNLSFEDEVDVNK